MSAVIKPLTSDVSVKAAATALEANQKQAEALHPDFAPDVDARPWLRWTETEPGKLDAEAKAFADEFARLRMAPAEAGHIVNRSMWFATAEQSKREKYRAQEDAEHAMRQIARDWPQAKNELVKWLGKEAPKVLAMLTKSGAANDSAVLRDLYQAWTSARGRGQA